ncbi:bacteriocin [Elizabethkingia anophelis]|jgi:bacteriocin-like protein|uniref:bacteriocin n=1 Tax=Elizabethkingia anophelis TaxID=1117645 RepID=UPI0038912E7F
MKKKIADLKVKELNKKELREVQGGGFGPFNFGLQLGYSLYNKLNLEKSWKDQYKEMI